MRSRTSLNLPVSLKARVAALAEHSGKSAHDYLVDAIERDVAIAEVRRAFVDDALNAERDMERTGLAYDARDLHAYWRARLSGKKPRKPQLEQWRAQSTRPGSLAIWSDCMISCAIKPVRP